MDKEIVNNPKRTLIRSSFVKVVIVTALPFLGLFVAEFFLAIQ
jgi:hypothetical protein